MMDVLYIKYLYIKLFHSNASCIGANKSLNTQVYLPILTIMLIKKTHVLWLNATLSISVQMLVSANDFYLIISKLYNNATS